eukprot:TRINITY_DN13324_c0_g2_i1.p2 TRINITY_DN13324_c0_g2~~TRINITY_DN13324_c0_g2_i1.p2  ORF type:complete len:559 (+),score=164.65 TRINITY_DN13324_c0_g2_i1:78-1754(+)
MISAAALLAAATLSARSPDILFILADDLGYNELGFMNGTRGLITPNLDKLAQGGVALHNYYVQPICSPTRSAFMTGRYTVRLGTQSNVIYWDTPWGIALNETFLPQVLRAAGYSTAMFGKWHLGMFKQEYTPSRRGFDEYMGYYQGCESAYTHVAACCGAGSPTGDQHYVCHGPREEGQEEVEGGKDYRGYDWFKTGPESSPANATAKPDLTANETNSAYLIRDAAIDYIKRHASSPSPFFLYLPFQNIHGPYTCDPKYRGMYANNSALNGAEMTMFGYITEMDDAVGHVIAQLKESGRYDNSVIVFSSDNGAPPAGQVDHQVGKDPGWIARNYPFRGHKALIWEGGTRVAGFVHSPLLPAAVRGTVSKELFHITDWLPTLARVAANKPPGSLLPTQPLDGHDIWDSISKGQPSPRTEVLYNVNPLCHAGQAGAPKAALRVGRYKVLSYCYEIAGIAGGNQTRPVPAPADASNVDPGLKKGPLLYDLEADPAETTNLAQDPKHADTLQSLLRRLAELAEQSVEPMQWAPPYQGPAYECADCPLHPGGSGAGVPWEPWL